MKKLLSAALAGMMAVSLAACGSSSSSTETASTEAASTEASSEAASTEAASTEAASTEAASTETASAESASSFDASASKYLSDGVLTVGTNATFPPFEYIDSQGNPVGFDVAMMEEIGSRLGVETEINDMDFDGIVAAIGTKVDCGAAGMTITEERKQQVNFSDPYYDATQCVLLQKDSTIATKDDLAAAAIEVQLGTTGETIARDLVNSDDQVTAVTSFNQAVQDLKNGKVDAVILDTAPAAAFQSQFPDDLKVIDGSEFEFDVEQYAIALPKDDDVLLQGVNDALAAMKEDGTYDQLVNDYITNYEAE